MTQPLALLCHQNLMPGSKLVTRLEDLGYRVKVIATSTLLGPTASGLKPLVVFVDLRLKDEDPSAAIRLTHSDPGTAHIPILAYSDGKDSTIETAAREAGAALIVHETGLLSQLPHLLEQALELP